MMKKLTVLVGVILLAGMSAGAVDQALATEQITPRQAEQMKMKQMRGSGLLLMGHNQGHQMRPGFAPQGQKMGQGPGRGNTIRDRDRAHDGTGSHCRR